MPTCSKHVTFPGRGGAAQTPTLAYRCEISLGDNGEPHEGPCASPSMLASVIARKDWETKDKEEKAKLRHERSGMAMTQSLPLTSASMIEPGSQKPHPSSPTDCPFCNEKPMHKEFVDHMKSHAGDNDVLQPVVREEVREDVSPAVKRSWSSSWDLAQIGAWLKHTDAPDDVLTAWSRHLNRLTD